MNVDCLKIAKVIQLHSEREIRGRKRLQKTIYVLKRLGFELNERFTYLHYGPYSYDLFDEIIQLVSWGIIQEKEKHGMEYSYHLTDKGDEDLKEKSQDLFSNEAAIKKAINLMDNFDSRHLEVLSTYYYITDSGLTHKDALRKLGILKPNHQKYYKEAFALKDELDSIKSLTAE